MSISGPRTPPRRAARVPHRRTGARRDGLGDGGADRPVAPAPRRERSMIRLLGAETSLLLSRRFTLITPVAVLLAVGAFQLAVNDKLRPPTAADQASGQPSTRRPSDSGRRTNEPARKPATLLTAATTNRSSATTFTRPYEEVARDSCIGHLPGRSHRADGGRQFHRRQYSTGSIANWLSFLPAAARFRQQTGHRGPSSARWSVRRRGLALPRRWSWPGVRPSGDQARRRAGDAGPRRFGGSCTRRARFCIGRSAGTRQRPSVYCWASSSSGRPERHPG